MIQLRDYQSRAVESTLREWESVRSTLLEHDEALNRFSRPASFDQTAPKIAYMTQESKNRSHDKAKNRPDIISRVRLIAVIREADLEGLLKVFDEPDWFSRVRLRGLML